MTTNARRGSGPTREMSIQSTPLCDLLGIDFSVLNAPMSGTATADLAASVAYALPNACGESRSASSRSALNSRQRVAGKVTISIAFNALPPFDGEHGSRRRTQGVAHHDASLRIRLFCPKKAM